MTRIPLRIAAAALAFSLAVPATLARASEPLDQSNSASATGNPFSYGVATTRGSLTAVPGNRTSNPTDAAYALRAPIAETTMLAGTPNVNWSNSSSATGSPDTFMGSTRGTLLAEARGGQ